jgi:hypothetical protein
VIAPTPDLTHLIRLTDDVGLLEHARFATARREHGYCTDDVSRGLIIVSREAEPSPETSRMSDCYFSFLLHAQDEGGGFRNRLGFDRRWEDMPGVGDWWGRALWGLGTAAVSNPASWIRAEARAAFDRSAHLRSSSPHAMAFAGIGAVQVLRAYPEDRTARELLQDAVAAVGVPDDDPEWCWPLDRLTYANAALAEVVIAAGWALDDERLTVRGLRMLSWLCRVQSSNGRLSMISAQGWRRHAERARYDQQPIEVAALADACATAASVTQDVRWEGWVDQAVGWFLGANDAGVPMWDPQTGGGFDGLTATGPNMNQGAESTMALISTFQHARRLSVSAATHG